MHEHNSDVAARGHNLEDAPEGVDETLAPNGKEKVVPVLQWEKGSNPALIIADVLLAMRRANWSMSDRQAFLARVHDTDYDNLLAVLREYAVIESNDE